MQPSLTRNIGKDKDVVPYFVRVDLATEVVEPNSVYRIPVYRQRTDDAGGNVKDLYSVEVCGFRIEAGNLNNILRLTGRVLPGLINMARLPTYVFIARHSRRMYPVYTIGDEVFATTPGGPVFRHVELANVRRYLSAYLHAVGELGGSRGSETLHVRGVHTTSLALIRPVFYFKKRIPGENEFWAPVFPADDGGSIYTYAASAKRRVASGGRAGGGEVLALRDVVAEALIADGRLKHTYDLRPDRLMPDYWDRLHTTLHTTSHVLEVFSTNSAANGTTMEVYCDESVCIAVEVRSSENRFGLFVGENVYDLRDRVALDYFRRNLIGSPEAVRIAPARRAERTSMLDALLRTSTHIEAV